MRVLVRVRTRMGRQDRYAGPGLGLRLDTSVRYNAGVRAEKIDPALGNSPNFDETDYRFGRGRRVMNRLDLLSEPDVS